MTKLYNLEEYKNIRKELRRTMPKGEVVLWQYLKNKQLGCRFRRQYGIKRYILDFFSPEIKLCIEVDGLSHDNELTLVNDKKREDYLKSVGIEVLRYTSKEVFDDINGVINNIKEKIDILKNV